MCTNNVMILNNCGMNMARYNCRDIQDFDNDIDDDDTVVVVAIIVVVVDDVILWINDVDINVPMYNTIYSKRHITPIMI